MAEPDPFPDDDVPAQGRPAPIELLDVVRDHARERGIDRRAITAVVSLFVVAVLAVWLLRPAPTPLEETLPMAGVASSSPSAPGAAPDATTTAPEGDAVPAEIVVHAAGAVARPGVYRLHATARVDDLVVAAGGLGPDADLSRLNLAAPLADGSRVYVPATGEEVPEAVGPDLSGPTEGAGGAPGAPGDAPVGGLVDLNTADEALLDTLPGVGPATATAIVAHRTENGPFTSVEGLLDVRGIGEAKLEQIRPLATV